MIPLLATVAVAADAPVQPEAAKPKAYKPGARERFYHRARVLVARTGALAHNAIERLESNPDAEAIARTLEDLDSIRHLVAVTLSPNEAKNEEEGVTP